MKFAIVILFVLLSFNASAKLEHTCSSDAAKQAKKLLIFHINSGLGSEIDIENEMGFEEPSVQKPIKNPTNPKQKLEVFEVIGYVNPHGEYRMKLIFFKMPNGCLLMGQEILEHANI